MKRKSNPQQELKQKPKKKTHPSQFSIVNFLSQSTPSKVKEETIHKKNNNEKEIKENKTIMQEVQKERAKREHLLVNKGLLDDDDNSNSQSNHIQLLKINQKAFDNIIFPIIIKTPLGINKEYSLSSLKTFINKGDEILRELSPKYSKDSVELEYQEKTIGYITKTISYYLCRIAPHSAILVDYYLNSNNFEIIITTHLKSSEIKLEKIEMKGRKSEFYQVSYGKKYLGLSLMQNMMSMHKYSLNSQLELIDDDNNKKSINNNKAIENIYELISNYHFIKKKIKENNKDKDNNSNNGKDTNNDISICTSNNNDSDNTDDNQSETRKLYHSFLVSNYEHILSMITSYSFLFTGNEISVARKALDLNASEKTLLLKFITRSSKWVPQSKLGLNTDEELNSLVSYSLIQSSNIDSILIENQSELFEFLYYLNKHQLKSIQSKLHNITKLKPSQVSTNFIPEIFINNSFYTLDAYLDTPELCDAARQISRMITEYNFDIEEQKKVSARSSSIETFSRHFTKEIANRKYNNYISKNLNNSNYRKVHLTQKNRTSKSLLIISIIQDVTSYLNNKSSMFIDNFIFKRDCNDSRSSNSKKDIIGAILKQYQMYKLDFLFGKVFDCASRLFFFYSQNRDINSIAKQFYGIELYEVYHNYLSNIILSNKPSSSNEDSYTEILKPIFTSEESFKLYDNLYQIKNLYMITSLTITSAPLNYSILSSLYIQLLKYLNKDLYDELFANQSFPLTDKDKEKTITTQIKRLKHLNMTHLNDDFLSKYSPSHISAELLTYYAELCEKSKEYYKANIIYLYLLLSDNLLKKRGHWWYRAILNFTHHLRKKYYAVQLFNIAYSDKTIKTGFLIKIKEYYFKLIREKIKSKKSNKILNMLQEGLFTFINTEEHNCDYHQFFRIITSESVVSDEYKKRLYGINNDIVSVEEYALKYYNKVHGYEGIHGENEVIPTLYNVFFWNAIYFDRIPHVFQSPYQAFPLDFFYSNFYESRRDIINTRLKEIEALNEKELIETINSIYLNKININSVFINWNSFGVKKDTLIKIAIAITAPKLALIFSFLNTNMKYLTKGMPDLFLWKQKDDFNSISNSALIVEVKSVNDKLSDHQKFWLSLLSKANINVEVLHIK